MQFLSLPQKRRLWINNFRTNNDAFWLEEDEDEDENEDEEEQALLTFKEPAPFSQIHCFKKIDYGPTDGGTDRRTNPLRLKATPKLSISTSREATNIL